LLHVAAGYLKPIIWRVLATGLSQATKRVTKLLKHGVTFYGTWNRSDLLTRFTWVPGSADVGRNSVIGFVRDLLTMLFVGSDVLSATNCL
jgi:hypothetical protein